VKKSGEGGEGRYPSFFAHRRPKAQHGWRIGARRRTAVGSRFGPEKGRKKGQKSRVERWRGGLGAAYRFPALSSAGAALAGPCSVSTSRSSNRTGGFPASGSRTRLIHAFAHVKRRGSFAGFSNPRGASRYWSEYWRGRTESGTERKAGQVQFLERKAGQVRDRSNFWACHHHVLN